MGSLPRRAPVPAETLVLLEALGTAGATAAVDRAVAGGPAALAALLDALARGTRFDNDSHPADFFAGLADCVRQLARAQPDAFIAAVERRPALLELDAVLGAAAVIHRPEADRWLFDAIARRGGRRATALSLLVRRGDARVAPQLAAMLSDRSTSVQFDAIDGLRRWGTTDDVGALERCRDKAPIGIAEYAVDAIESICFRAGAPLPPGHPGPRLTEVELPRGAVIEANLCWLQVPVGFVLATAAGRAVRAPRAGLVVGIDADGDGHVRRIVLRGPSR